MGAKKKLKYVFYAVLYAVVHFLLTAGIFADLSEGDVFTATIWNMVFIMLMVFLEKGEIFLLAKIYSKYNYAEKKKGILKRILLSYLTGPSVKSSLYFFYVVIIICSALIAADPSFFDAVTIDGFPFRDYLQSVRYGVLLLVAADKFFDQILKDIKQNRKIEDEDTKS